VSRYVLQPAEQKTAWVPRRSNSRSNSSSTMLLSKGESTPLTQKVILAAWRFGAPVLRRSGRNRNAVTNGDGILADQNFFNQQSHDFLTFNDTKSFRSTAQASKKRGEGFC